MLVNKNKGFALMVALFLIVVLSVVAMISVKILVEQNDNALQEFLDNKLYYAANAGLEWGTYQVLVKDECTDFSPKTDLPMDSINQARLSTSITCVVDNASEDIYTVTSTATVGSPGDKDYMFRKLKRVIDK